MTLLNFYIYILVLLSCGNANQKKVIIIGKAENNKGEAYVVSDKDKNFYYVDGVYLWGDNIVGKTVKITGKLLIQHFEPTKKGEILKQQIVGTKSIILKAKWKLIK